MFVAEGLAASYFPPWAECQESFGWLPTGPKPRYSFWRTQDTSKLHPEGLRSQNALLVDGLLPGKVTGCNSLPYFFFFNYRKGLLCFVCVHSFFLLPERDKFFFHFQRYSEDSSCWTVWQNSEGRFFFFFGGGVRSPSMAQIQLYIKNLKQEKIKSQHPLHQKQVKSS